MILYLIRIYLIVILYLNLNKNIIEIIHVLFPNCMHPCPRKTFVNAGYTLWECVDLQKKQVSHLYTYNKKYIYFIQKYHQFPKLSKPVASTSSASDGDIVCVA